MSAPESLIEAHVDREESFIKIGSRTGVHGVTAYYRFNQAVESELDALEALLKEGSIQFAVPTGDTDTFIRTLNRVKFVIRTLYERRDVVLRVSTVDVAGKVTFELRLA